MYDNIVKVIDNSKIVVGYTNRKGGFSKSPFFSFNLGLNTNDNSVKKNREYFCSNFSDFSIKYLNQIHSNIVHSVDKDFINQIDGDGLITFNKKELLTITVADCGNVMFYDKKNYSSVANIHAGWRGQYNKIVEKTVNQLKKSVDIDNIAVVIGPMIRGDNYEVTEEFLEKFPNQYFKKKSNSKYNFYIENYLIDTLINLGINDITDTKLNTYTNKEDFFSYRRDGETGRILSFIGLK